MNSQEIEELKKQWAREQIELQQKAIFTDHDLSFHTSPSGVSAKPNEAGAPDYDDPTVHNEDPKAFKVTDLRYVGGLDISFIAQEGNSVEGADFPGHNASDPNVPDAYAVIVVLEYPSLSLVHSITHPIRLTAPYIPSFLSYRETPAYLELISKLRENLQKAGKEHEFPQVILVDGNGQLHVREAGVATAVGVQANVPTVGVAKTYHPPTLHGHEAHESHWRLSQKGMKQKSREVLKRPGDYLGVLNAQRDRYVGVALRSATSANFLYVSPGHRVSLIQAIRLTMTLSKYRIPEPIRLADRLGRDAAAAVAVTDKARDGNGCSRVPAGPNVPAHTSRIVDRRDSKAEMGAASNCTVAPVNFSKCLYGGTQGASVPVGTREHPFPSLDKAR